MIVDEAAAAPETQEPIAQTEETEQEQAQETVATEQQQTPERQLPSQEQLIEAMRQLHAENEQLRQATAGRNSEQQQRQTDQPDPVVVEMFEIDKLKASGKLQEAYGREMQLRQYMADQSAQRIFQEQMQRLVAPVAAQRAVLTNPQLEDIRELAPVVAAIEEHLAQGRGITDRDVVSWMRLAKKAIQTPQISGRRRGRYMEGVDDGGVPVSTPDLTDKDIDTFWRSVGI